MSRPRPDRLPLVPRAHDGMTLDVDYLAKYLVGTAGGYLTNVNPGDGFCPVCTTPIR